MVPNYAAAQPGTVEAGKRAAVVAAWSEFQTLATIKCKICNGFGHNHKDCPTAKRITAFCKASLTARNRLAQARDDVIVA